MRHLIAAPFAVAWLLTQLIRESFEEACQRARDFRDLATKRGE